MLREHLISDVIISRHQSLSTAAPAVVTLANTFVDIFLSRRRPAPVHFHGSRPWTNATVQGLTSAARRDRGTDTDGPKRRPMLLINRSARGDDEVKLQRLLSDRVSERNSWGGPAGYSAG